MFSMDVGDFLCVCVWLYDCTNVAFRLNVIFSEIQTYDRKEIFYANANLKNAKK